MIYMQFAVSDVKTLSAVENDSFITPAAMVKPAMLEDAPIKERRTFEADVRGTLRLSRTCLPHPRQSAAQAIVAMSSPAAAP